MTPFRVRNLKMRARIVQAIRDFFTDRGYLEVETPNRIPAPAPEAHIDALPAGGWWLHTSPELCMKRLLAAGFPRIFQISKCYRKNERGDRHLEEFTLLEWYAAEKNYTDLMAETEALICHVAAGMNTPDRLVYQGRPVDLFRPWPRITVKEAFDRYAPMSMAKALSAGRFDEMIGLEIEPNLPGDRPCFLYDYPAACGALARRKPGEHSVVERFELYLSGMEICNAFSELIDPEEQRARFSAETAVRAASGKPVYPSPERFLEDLARMPEAAGNALGVDRLVMLFTNAAAIDEVVAFTPESL